MRSGGELRRWAELWGDSETKRAAQRIAELVEAGEAGALANVSTIEDGDLKNGECALLRNLARLMADLLYAEGVVLPETMAGIDAADEAIWLMSKCGAAA